MLNRKEQDYELNRKDLYRKIDMALDEVEKGLAKTTHEEFMKELEKEFGLE